VIPLQPFLDEGPEDDLTAHRKLEADRRFRGSDSSPVQGIPRENEKDSRSIFEHHHFRLLWGHRLIRIASISYISYTVVGVKCVARSFGPWRPLRRRIFVVVGVAFVGSAIVAAARLRRRGRDSVDGRSGKASPKNERVDDAGWWRERATCALWTMNQGGKPEA
jgi:hypothetical protein